MLDYTTSHPNQSLEPWAQAMLGYSYNRNAQFRKYINQMNEIDISRLIKASDVFERFRIDMVTDRDQAGAVQAFEFCYELAWKIMKRFLETQGFECGSPKDTFRKAALEKIIDDPELWFEFQKKTQTNRAHVRTRKSRSYCECLRRLFHRNKALDPKIARTSIMHIEPRHLSIVLDILKKYPFTFYAFGSRAKGNPKKFSDLDLCFIENIPGNMLSQIDEDFEESDLPYKVDVINWNTCDKSFQNIIRSDLVLVQLGQNGMQCG